MLDILYLIPCISFHYGCFALVKAHVIEIKFEISAEFYMVIRNISTKALIIGRLDMLLDTLNVTYCQKIYMNAVI